MKRIILVYFVPLFIVFSFLFLFSSKINSVFFYPKVNLAIDSSFKYLENFRNTPFYEDQFLISNDSTETIFILGSSELTGNGEAHPFNFISSHFKTKLKGIGHAGNQCFSIYSQLLANENRLKNAPVVIVLSPGWFSENANGTSSSLFLEFNSSRFLNNIFENNSIPQFKKYEAERISDFYNEISNPDLSISMLYLENQSSKNILSKFFYFPNIEISKVLNIFKFELTNTRNKKTDITERKSIVTESIKINWDSIFNSSKQEQLNNCTNNKWYIDNEYYSKYTNGKTNMVNIVKDKNNQELKDFKMLLSLLKTKEVNASFIILPLNPYCYVNSDELSQLINSIQNDILKNHFSCMNFWNTDTAKYDKGILKDIMHLSNYGWYKADKFIIETYKLLK